MNNSTTIPQDDGWRDLDTMPDSPIHVLFIEGYCMVSWMEARIQRNGFHGNGFCTKRVWVTDPSYRNKDDDGPPPDLIGADKAIQEIESGFYHGIVVVDYSNQDESQEFEDTFGLHLQKFVQNGGVVAFPSSEGLLVSTLSKLFETTWTTSNYYRTTWGPCPENECLINYSFGNGNLARRVIGPYSAKGVSLRNVPVQERCFGVTCDSRTQSLVPMMAGRDVSRPDDPDSVAASELEPDYDVLVAMHDYGKGCIAYFGDVNCEERTTLLVEAFITSRCPQKSIDCFAALDCEAFAKVQEYKEQGNACFNNGQLQDAIEFYDKAVAMYGSCTGTHGEQRDTLVTLYSNMALVYSKTKSWEKSEACASKALALDIDHDKSLYRRAEARYQLSLSKLPQGDIRRLHLAKSDILNMSPVRPDSRKALLKLLDMIELEIKRLEKRQKDRFARNFAGALK